MEELREGCKIPVSDGGICKKTPAGSVGARLTWGSTEQPQVCHSRHAALVRSPTRP